MISALQQGIKVQHFDEDELDVLASGFDPGFDGNDGVRLKVPPKWAMYTVPRIFGLDEYGYDVGTRMAERSEARLQQQLSKEKAEVKLPRPSSAAVLSDVPGSQEVVREAGATGSALVLWNYSQANSTDSGALQLRKRRQKLTDDLLRQIVLDHKDSFGLVSWWFAIFAHHVGPAQDAALPARPQREEREEAPEADAGATLKRLPMTGRGSHVTLKLPGQAVRTSAEVPRLREKAEIVKVKRASVDEEKCEQRRNDLKKDRQMMRQAGLVGNAAGELDLMRRFREERLDSDKLDSWVRSYDFIQDLRRKQQSNPQPLQKNSRLASQRRKNRKLLSTFRRTSRPDSDTTTRYLRRISKSVNDDITNEVEEDIERGSSAASSGDESMTTSVVSAATHPLNGEMVDSSAREVMLRSSSLALLNSSIMRKTPALGQEKRAKPTYDEVMKTRAQVLRSVAPVEISISNLANVLQLFGIQRKRAVERMARFLLIGVPHKSQRKSGAEEEEEAEDSPREGQDLAEERTLPFEVFYRLMKALGGPATTTMPPFNDPKSRLESDEDESRYVQAWTDSVLLRRMLFTALTGQAGVSFRVGATEQRKADAMQSPITLASLLESLKLMLCAELFLEVDTRDGRNDGEEAGDPRQLASGGFDGQLQCFAEFLLAELCRCEAACTSQAKPNERSSGVSYTGFEHFIACWNEVYVGLLLMLAPVAQLGSRLLSEEMELAQKKLTHRAGELRAKAEKQSHRLQRRQMAHLVFEYALPWHEKARGIR